MNRIRLLLASIIVTLIILPLGSKAADIDIYSGLTGAAGIPNVLLVLDNAANFSASAANCTYADGTSPSLDRTAGGIEQCAIWNVINSLQSNPDGTARINLGLMIYNANRFTSFGCPEGGNGGCLIRPLAPMTAANRTAFMNWIKTWTTSGSGADNIKANVEATAATMQEAWAYYAGNTGLSDRSYASIKPEAGCQKNFVIFIGNAFTTSGTPGDGGSTSPHDALVRAPGVTTAQLADITIPSGSYGTSSFSCGTYTMGNHTDSSGLYADEWARYMKGTDIYGTMDGTQNIVTYTVGLLGSSCKPDFPALLKSAATHGGGKYFATSSYDEIVQALLKILNEVQAVNSVFSSSSLPVSVNTQGTYLNQIFMGMFRPDQNGFPRWLGNLKQYQFIYDTTAQTLALGDSAGEKALSSAGTGFISPDAISYWTTKNTSTAPDSTGGFWVNQPNGAGGGYDSPDGELVEKGGAAQQTRLANLTDDYTQAAGSTGNPRKLYTYCPSGSSCNPDLTNSVNAFATTNSAITASLFGASTAVNISSITRSGTTVTVNTTGNHGFSNGDSISIGGATPDDYNGAYTISTSGGSQFTYSITVTPSSPATGTITASIPSSAQVASSITRSGSTATATLASHGYANGQSVTISGATQTAYNGTFIISGVTTDTFNFTVTEGPTTTAGSGTATSDVYSNGSKTWVSTPATIAAIATPGVSRTAGSTTVTITTTANHNFTAGRTVVISGVKDASNNTVAEYNGTFTIASTPGNRTFTITISGTTPATPATGTFSVTTPGVSKSVTSITRSNTTSTVNLTDHGFASGWSITIAGANETAYNGTYAISNVTANTFDYTVTTSPVSPATGASMTAAKATAPDKDTLLNWVRGHDNYGDEASPGSPYTVRPSIHGDVLHSRPVVINYGGTTGVMVYYGANDGVYRAVNGNQTGTNAGKELWGFIPTEFFDKLNRQRTNSPVLQLPSTPQGILPAPQPKDYFADGPTSVYQAVNSSGTTDTAYIYIAMRRGGRYIYALDVTTPSSPQLLWKKSYADTGFGELGQTWSQPKMAFVKGYVDGDGNPKPVLIFGAGYDTYEDSEPPVADTEGRGIFVLDAATGAPIWQAGPAPTGAGVNHTVTSMTHSIPADITLVDRDFDGLIDRLYAVDLGGNVWRVDLEPTAGSAPANWQTIKLAALGCATGACTTGTPRKFFYAADVITTNSGDAVLVGSGDREHPLYSNASYNVTNRFYMLEDSAIGKDGLSMTTSGYAPITEASLFNMGTAASLFDITTGQQSATEYSDPTNAYKGYYITLGSGEKAVNAATTVAGYTYFGTNQPTAPSTTSCTATLGVARGYQVQPLTGKTRFVEFSGGGLPPSPVAGLVNITIGGQTKQVPFCIGCGNPDSGCTGPDCESALGGGKPPIDVPTSRTRTYWYFETDE